MAEMIIGSFKIPSDPYRPPLFRLSDEIDLILEYLNYKEQSEARLMGPQFNEIINKSHHILRYKFQRFKLCASEIIESGIANRSAYLLELATLATELRYNEVFIKLWANEMQKCIQRSKSPANETKLNAHQFRLSLGCSIHYDSSIAVDTVSKTLVYSSKILLRSLTSSFDPRYTEVMAADYDAFNALVMQSTWHYLSSPIRDKSERLPPLHSIYNLHKNQALYEEETKYLEKLRTGCGLVIWDPHRLMTLSHFRIQGFCFFMNRCLGLNDWMNACDDGKDPQFRWYINIEIIMNILRDRDFVKDFSNFPDQGFHPLALFKQMVRMRVAHLWVRDRKNDQLDRLLLRLIESNALGILPKSNESEQFVNHSLTTFVGILRAIRLGYSELSSHEVLSIAKSIYY